MGKAERAHHTVKMGTGIRPLLILLSYWDEYKRLAVVLGGQFEPTQSGRALYR